ncbi:MAG: FG-GAP-like repeat-containing protein [Thermoplasmata archaeon]
MSVITIIFISLHSLFLFLLPIYPAYTFTRIAKADIRTSFDTGSQITINLPLGGGTNTTSFKVPKYANVSSASFEISSLDIQGSYPEQPSVSIGEEGNIIWQFAGANLSRFGSQTRFTDGQSQASLSFIQNSSAPQSTEFLQPQGVISSASLAIQHNGTTPYNLSFKVGQSEVWRREWNKFRPLSPFPSPTATSVKKVSVAELTGDTYRDIIFITADGKLYFTPNSGVRPEDFCGPGNTIPKDNGSGIPPLGVPTAIYNGSSYFIFDFAAKDMDGDGDNDIVAVSNNKKIVMFRNDGQSWFTIELSTAPVQYLTITAPAAPADTKVFIGSQDGKLSAVSYDNNQQSLTIFTTIQASANLIVDTAAGYLEGEGDGYEDVAFIMSNSQVMYSFWDDFNNTFRPAQNLSGIPFVNTQNLAITLMKFDSDERPDIVFTRDNLLYVSFWRSGNIFSTVGTSPFNTPDNIVDIAHADIDNDSSDDILLLTASGKLYVLDNEAGSINKYDVYQADSSEGCSVGIVDIDRNGYMDVVTGGGKGISILKHQGGAFEITISGWGQILQSYLATLSPFYTDEFNTTFFRCKLNFSNPFSDTVRVHSLNITYIPSLRTIDFASSANSYVRSHRQDAGEDGMISIPVIVKASSAGTITLSNLVVKYAIEEPLFSYIDYPHAGSSFTADTTINLRAHSNKDDAIGLSLNYTWLIGNTPVAYGRNASLNLEPGTWNIRLKVTASPGDAQNTTEVSVVVTEVPKAILKVKTVNKSLDDVKVGDLLRISAIVENKGNRDATDVMVRFTDKATGNTIETKTIPSIPIGNESSAVITWKAEKGTKTIAVYIINGTYQVVLQPSSNENILEFTVHDPTEEEKLPRWAYYLIAGIIIIVVLGTVLVVFNIVRGIRKKKKKEEKLKSELKGPSALDKFLEYNRSTGLAHLADQPPPQMARPMTRAPSQLTSKEEEEEEKLPEDPFKSSFKLGESLDFEDGVPVSGEMTLKTFDLPSAADEEEKPAVAESTAPASAELPPPPQPDKKERKRPAIIPKKESESNTSSSPPPPSSSSSSPVLTPSRKKPSILKEEPPVGPSASLPPPPQAGTAPAPPATPQPPESPQPASTSPASPPAPPAGALKVKSKRASVCTSCKEPLPSGKEGRCERCELEGLLLARTESVTALKNRGENVDSIVPLLLDVRNAIGGGDYPKAHKALKDIDAIISGMNALKQSPTPAQGPLKCPVCGETVEKSWDVCPYCSANLKK